MKRAYGLPNTENALFETSFTSGAVAVAGLILMVPIFIFAAAVL